MKRRGKYLIVFLVLLLSIVFKHYFSDSHEQKGNNNWILLWEDKFEEVEMEKNNWSLQVGGGTWGNNELQCYTDRKANCRIEDGKLVLEVHKDNYQDYAYTSARITTKRKISFLFGKIEIKAKLPKGKGLLPAIWLLPVEDTYNDRKMNGEIDIMEMLGENTQAVYGVAHYFLDDDHKSWEKFYNKKIDFSEEFHTFSLEWTEEELRWFIDDKEYHSLNLIRKFDSEYNPFHKEFYLIMNIAVGGDWPGNNIDDNMLPARMEVDYVKYFKKSEVAAKNT